MSDVKITAEHITRTQTMRAMERLMLGLGGKNAYIAWLEAMPADATLNASGGLDMGTINRIAADDSQYKRIVRAFASHMGKVLTDMAAE